MILFILLPLPLTQVINSAAKTYMVDGKHTNQEEAELDGGYPESEDKVKTVYNYQF
jgi:hypothetical protein